MSAAAKVLVVDDTPNNVKLLSDLLSVKGYAVATAAKLPNPPTVAKSLPGRALENLAARHPFINRASPIVLAEYVTTDSGTGCVHTAPGHGAEDYQTGLKYKLEIYCPVGDDGRYLDDGRVPADLVGLTKSLAPPTRSRSRD